MNAPTLRDQLFQAELRIVGIYPLEGFGDPEGAPDWLEEFCDYSDNGNVEDIFAAFPELNRFIGTFPNKGEVAEALIWANRRGFIIKAEWCQRRYLSETTFRSGWGVMRFDWFFSETVEEGFQKVIAAAAEDHEAQRRATAGAA